MTHLFTKLGNYLIGLTALLTFHPTLALAQGTHGEWQPNPGMMMGWGMGIFGMLFMFIFWGLIIVGLVFLIKWLFQSTRKADQSTVSASSALEILKERYARGEIERDEFEAKKRDLMI